MNQEIRKHILERGKKEGNEEHTGYETRLALCYTHCAYRRGSCLAEM